MKQRLTWQRHSEGRYMHISVAESREVMGRLAAEQAAKHLQEAVARHGLARVAFAAAPSQDEFLAALRQDETIAWDKVMAFHLDEYAGLPPVAPQRFARYLDQHLFDYVALKEVHYLDLAGLAPEEACRRYEALLGEEPLHLACIGIGENGHIAFNDPHMADFNDPKRVKIVELDEMCRQQQVNDGCFLSLEEVPQQAITITIPTITSAEALVCVVPGERKRQAVQRALRGPLSPACPASILRTHKNTTLFLDQASGEGLELERQDKDA
jgi:glucosamine-6-phosphate deaminase